MIFKITLNRPGSQNHSTFPLGHLYVRMLQLFCDLLDSETFTTVNDVPLKIQ